MMFVERPLTSGCCALGPASWAIMIAPSWCGIIASRNARSKGVAVFSASMSLDMFIMLAIPGISPWVMGMSMVCGSALPNQTLRHAFI